MDGFFILTANIFDGILHLAQESGCKYGIFRRFYRIKVCVLYMFCVVFNGILVFGTLLRD